MAWPPALASRIAARVLRAARPGGRPLLDDRGRSGRRSPIARWRVRSIARSRSREIEAALTANDADLAKSFVDLARRPRRRVPPELRSASKPRWRRPIRPRPHAESFARGLITGEPDNMVGPRRHRARRSVRVRRHPRRGPRGSRYVNGEKVDELVLGLSLVGIAVTAGTYASFGAARAGAGRAVGGEGGAQDRPARRAHGRLDRPLAARGDRLVGAAARGRLAGRTRVGGAGRARSGEG